MARFVIRRLKAEIETLSRLESIADGRRAASLDMADLAMPLSIFEIALASNMFGREFIRMTLDGTLKYEDEIKVEDKDKVMADSLNGKTLNS